MSDYDDAESRYLREMYDFGKNEAAYKDQLASALLAFNRIESMIADMIATVLYARGRGDMIEKVVGDRPFAQQLEALELLLSSMRQAPRLPVKRLKSIGNRRNEFAHGHFTASVNTGKLIIKSRAHSEAWNPDKVAPFIRDCAEVKKELDALYPWIAFGDAPAPVALPLGAIPIPTSNT